MMRSVHVHTLGPLITPAHKCTSPSADQYLRRTEQPPFRRYVAEQVRWISATHDKRGQRITRNIGEAPGPRSFQE